MQQQQKRNNKRGMQSGLYSFVGTQYYDELSMGRELKKAGIKQISHEMV
jgi:hypothetical protein